MFVMIIAITLAGAAIIVMAVNALSATTGQKGMTTSRLAEGLAEDVMIRLVRDPTWSGGSFSLEGSEATVAVVDGDEKTISVAVDESGIKRKFEVVAETSNNQLVVVSWKEDF